MFISKSPSTPTTRPARHDERRRQARREADAAFARRFASPRI